MFHVLTFYVPESHCEQVKNALFACGAGKFKNYDCCSWQVSGQGQFRPCKGSDPWRGKEGFVERLAEYRVEMVVDPAIIVDAIKALKQAHPYEEVAYHVYKAETLDDLTRKT